LSAVVVVEVHSKSPARNADFCAVPESANYQ
jgi:hypothetical protein